MFFDAPCRLQELEQMRSRIARDEVNVEVDSGANQPDLGSVLAGLRSQYEGIVKNNKEQAEQWYQKKVKGGIKMNQSGHSGDKWAH